MHDVIFATVGAVSASGVTLILAGEASATSKYYNCLNSYVPAVGDRVVVLKYGGTMLVLDKLKY